MSITVNIQHQGKTYVAEAAKIKSAELGLEDHGILGWNIDFEGPSWGQGSGWRGLGFETAYGTHVINELVKFAGRWNELPGKRVYVLREKDYGPIVGMSDLDGEKILLWDDIAEKTFHVKKKEND